MIILPIKRKWFDMILSGEKKEEYREIKPYYDSRLIPVFGIVPGEREAEICFKNGYSADAPRIYALCTLDRKEGKEEWGAEPGKKYYVLQIKEILGTDNMDGKGYVEHGV